jgi:hypothetical protein
MLKTHSDKNFSPFLSNKFHLTAIFLWAIAKIEFSQSANVYQLTLSFLFMKFILELFHL